MHMQTGSESVRSASAVPFPAWKSAIFTFPPRPVGHSELIGRAHDAATLAALVCSPDVRLITVTGAGGIGKTRLALEVAERFEEQYPNAVGFVALAHLHDPELIGTAVATDLRISRSGPGTLMEHIAAVFHNGPSLLIFDNFEQILTASPFVVELLALCPELTVLVTSTARLHVRGEHVFHLSPLGLGQSAADTISPKPSFSPAVELFIARATEVNPNFRVTTERVTRIEEICRKLNGLPLAIEIAAARSRVIPPESMLPLLDRRLAFLAGGPRDAPKRQQTIRNTIKWTYDLLPDHSRRLFRHLSVFPGGFTMDAAALVARRLDPQLDDAHDVLPEIESLADFNLVHVDTHDPGDDEARFSMYETIRSFGLEELAADGEVSSAYESLITWCLGLSKHTVKADSGGGFRQFDALEREYPNVRAALVWLRERREGGRGLRILQPLTWFMTQRYLLSEASDWADTFLTMPDFTSDRAEYATALNIAARIQYWYSDYRKAKPYNEQALAIWRDLGRTAEIGQTMIELATCLFDYDETSNAKSYLVACLELLPAADHPLQRAHATTLLARIALDQEELDHSFDLYLQALAQFRAIGQQTWAALIHEGLGLWHLVSGNTAGARAAYDRSLAMALELDDYWRVTGCVLGLGEVAHREGHVERAARLYSASTAIRFAMGITLRPASQRLFDRWLGTLRAAMSASSFERAWSEGARLSRQEAAELASAIDDLVPATARAQAPRSNSITDEIGMTKREIEILILLTQGLANREIAERLSISHRTVMQHVANIFPKIGVNSRSAAAAWAHQHSVV